MIRTDQLIQSFVCKWRLRLLLLFPNWQLYKHMSRHKEVHNQLPDGAYDEHLISSKHITYVIYLSMNWSNLDHINTTNYSYSFSMGKKFHQVFFYSFLKLCVNIRAFLKLHSFFCCFLLHHLIYIPIELINIILTYFSRYYCSEFVFEDKVVEQDVFLIVVVFLWDKV